MAKIIVSTGRGGVGKSSFVALASKYLHPPMLLIDLDPDESLAGMLGIDLTSQGKKTISDTLYVITEQNKATGRTGYDVLDDVLQQAIQSDCLYRSPQFDLITLGTKFTVGCYCTPDAVIREAIPALAQSYQELLIDSPAGLEHLNRKVVVDIDDLFVILDPSEKSLKHIERVRAITTALQVDCRHLHLVGNHRFTMEMEEHLRSTGKGYLGRIDFDPSVRQRNLEGRSLLDLSAHSPAALSVKRILLKAGYKLKQQD